MRILQNMFYEIYIDLNCKNIAKKYLSLFSYKLVSCPTHVRHTQRQQIKKIIIT